MTDVEETDLPGVGIRYDFVTSDGDRVGVLVHHSGRRDLLVYDREDPDSCRVSTAFSAVEARTVAELLGGSQVSEHIGAMQARVEGLALDWLPVPATSPLAGQTLAEAAVHTRTGVSIVAITRGDATLVAPGAGDQIQIGDTVIAVGSEDGMRAFVEYLNG